MIDLGFRAQRLAHKRGGRTPFVQRAGAARRPPPSASPPLKAQVIHFINKPMPGRLPEEDRARAARHRGRDDGADHPRPGEDDARIPRRCSIFPAAARSACSARWASPPRRCSTTSAASACCRRATCAAAIRRRAAGDADQGRARSRCSNRVLFHRVANTLNYLDIKTVVVSCGTCMDQLQKYEFDKIFPGCRLLDIHEYLMEKGVKLEGVQGVRYMYHDPCHSPMKTYQPMKVVNELMGAGGRAERALLRRVGHASRSRAPTSRPRCASARKRKCARARRSVRADGFDGRGEGAHLVPVLPAGPVALRQRLGHQRRLHRGRDGAPPARARTGCATSSTKANHGGIERVLL